jgi:hypothetical protein
VREHDDDEDDRKDHCLADSSRYRQTLCRQWGREKDSAELEDQQDGQARISDPILPSMKRLSPVADARVALMALPDHQRFHM